MPSLCNFGLEFEKNYCHFWNQRPWIFLIPKLDNRSISAGALSQERLDRTETKGLGTFISLDYRTFTMSTTGINIAGNSQYLILGDQKEEEVHIETTYWWEYYNT